MSLDELDRTLSEKLRLDERHPHFLKIARVLAHSGDSWLWCGVLFICWLFAEGKRERTLAFWGGTIALTALLVFFIKKLIARKRPNGEWGRIYREGDPYSFPSGHAVRAGLIIVLAFYTFTWPIAFCVTLWALLMTLSRVSTGLHYLGDILAGIVLGLLIGMLWMALRPWIFRMMPVLFDKSQ